MGGERNRPNNLEAYKNLLEKGKLSQNRYHSFTIGQLVSSGDNLNDVVNDTMRFSLENNLTEEILIFDQNEPQELPRRYFPHTPSDDATQ